MAAPLEESDCVRGRSVSACVNRPHLILQRLSARNPTSGNPWRTFQSTDVKRVVFLDVRGAADEDARHGVEVVVGRLDPP